MRGKKTIYKEGDHINDLVWICDDGYHTLPSGVKLRKCKFLCVCGNTFSTIITNVTTGRTKSCGCNKKIKIRDANKTHGKSKHPLYNTWNGQKSRCLNPKTIGYKYWGGRGIKFSDEFLDFNIWLEYVTSLPRYNEREELGLTLDRANNDGNYEKGNLRWVERTIQNENRRI